jgi:negative regulator of sigma E activity
VGSSSAFSTVVDGHQVTAVGEVPPTTVELIAKQVKASKAPAAATGAMGLAPQRK